MITTWRELIVKQLNSRNETWDDVEACTLSQEELLREFNPGHGVEEGSPFTVWTKDRVYFPACYDGAEWVVSVARNPDGKATYHVGK